MLCARPSVFGTERPARDEPKTAPCATAAGTVIATSYTAHVAKATKVMVSMPDDLLERIDRAAAERRTSRSAFLQEAARRELGWPDPAAVEAALERGRAALADAGRFESAKLIRRERDARDARD